MIVPACSTTSNTMTLHNSLRTDMVMLANAGSWCINSSSCSVSRSRRWRVKIRHTTHANTLTHDSHNSWCGNSQVFSVHYYFSWIHFKSHNRMQLSCNEIKKIMWQSENCMPSDFPNNCSTINDSDKKALQHHKLKCIHMLHKRYEVGVCGRDRKTKQKQKTDWPFWQAKV